MHLTLSSLSYILTPGPSSQLPILLPKFRSRPVTLSFQPFLGVLSLLSLSLFLLTELGSCSAGINVYVMYCIIIYPMIRNINKSWLRLAVLARMIK